MKLSHILRKAQTVKQKLTHPWTAAIIVAAGSAARMGGIDKIFAPIRKLPVICRTLAAFNNHPLIDEIIVVTRPDVLERMSRICVAYEKVRIVVTGGADRTASVRRGLDAVSEQTQLVAVQDGARPLVSEKVISAAVVQAGRCGAADRAAAAGGGPRGEDRAEHRHREPQPTGRRFGGGGGGRRGQLSDAAGRGGAGHSHDLFGG